MAKVKRDEVKNFSTAGNYFQLKDDGDSALVRFLFDKEEDVDKFIRSVHVLEKDNRSIDVDCIRTPEDPIENCPFCQEKIRLQIRFYIPLWDMDKEKVVWWTRSRGFIEKVIKQIREVDSESIAGTPFKIIRSGKAGSFDTSYEFIQQAKKADDKFVEDFVNPDELDPKEAGLIELDEKGMESYLDTGKLPETRKKDDSKIERRKGREVKAEEDEEEEEVRRTVRREGIRSRR